MSDWAQIKEDFYKHLKQQAKKENSKIDEKELKKVSENKAVVKYQDEFNKWVKTQKDIDEKDLQKNSIDLDDEENENFFDEMFDDYISDLDKDDKVYSSIDKNSDGKISSDEKKSFLSSIKGLDEDDENITIADFSRAVDNINQGKTNFLNSTNASENASSKSAAASSGGVSSGGGTGALNSSYASQSPAYTEQVNNASSVNETGQTQEEYSMELESNQETIDINFDANTVEDIDTQLELITQNKTACTDIQTMANDRLAECAGYQEVLQETLSTIDGQIIENDEVIQTTTQDYATIQEEYYQGMEVLDGYKESLTQANSSYDDIQNQINSLEVVEKPTIPSDATEEELAQIEQQINAYEAYKTTQSELNNEKAKIEQEIAELNVKIAQQEEQNSVTTENLTLVANSLAEAIMSNESLSEEQRNALADSVNIQANIDIANNTLACADAELALADAQEKVLTTRKAQLQAQTSNQQPTSNDSQKDDDEQQEEDNKAIYT